MKKKIIIMPYSLIPRLFFIGAFFALLVILYDFYEFSDFLDMFEKTFPNRYDSELYDLKYSPFTVCTVLFLIATPIPLTTLDRVTFKGDCVYFEIFSHNIGRNNIDTNWNDQVFLSEIVKIDVVRLTPEERKTCVSHRHLRNKYLKIQLKYGKCKYVYVGMLFNSQIRKLISMLTEENPYIPQRR